MIMLNSSLLAKEVENIIVGVGVGAGQSNLAIEHAQIMRHPILGGDLMGNLKGSTHLKRFFTNQK